MVVIGNYLPLALDPMPFRIWNLGEKTHRATEFSLFLSVNYGFCGVENLDSRSYIHRVCCMIQYRICRTYHILYVLYYSHLFKGLEITVHLLDSQRGYQLKKFVVVVEFFDCTRLISSGVVELGLCTSRFLAELSLE
jgi:hypothetical protein